MNVSELKLTAKFMRGAGCDLTPQGMPCFISPGEIIYIVGRYLITEDISTCRQTRFLLLPYPKARHFAISFEEGIVVAISFSNHPFIALLDLKDSREHFQIISTEEKVKGLAFSCDGQDLAFVTSHLKGKHKVSVWDIQEKKIVKTPCIMSSKTGVQSKIKVIVANLYDPHSYVVAGSGFMRKINYCERLISWKHVFYNLPEQATVLSVTWVDYWVMLVGCTDGLLRIVNHKKVMAVYHPLEMETFNVEDYGNPELPYQEKGVDLASHSPYIEHKWRHFCNVKVALNNSVSSAVVYKGGLAYVCLPNQVVIMQETTKHNYSRISTVRLDIGQMCDVHDIVNITVCKVPRTKPSVIICTTKQGQNYVLHRGLSPDDFSFRILGPRVHNGPITGLALSWLKNRLVSGSHDRQVLLWNLTTGEVEHQKRSDVGITDVAIDRTGFFIYVGSKHYTNMYMCRYKGLKRMVSFDMRTCSAVAISPLGLYIALVNDHNVMVKNLILFETKHVLTGNTSSIKRLVWSYKDDYLVSCSHDGIIWCWHVESNERQRYLDNEKVKFVDITLCKTRDVMLAVGNSPFIFTVDLRTARTGQIEAWSSLGAISCIALASEDLFLFVSGSEGSLVSVWNPFIDAKLQHRQIYPTYLTKITHLLISPGNEYLVTGSSLGTLTHWFIYEENRSLPEYMKTAIPVHLIMKEEYLKLHTELASLAHEINFKPRWLNGNLRKRGRDLNTALSVAKEPRYREIEIAKQQLKLLIEKHLRIRGKEVILKNKRNARIEELNEIWELKKWIKKVWSEILNAVGYELYLDSRERDLRTHEIACKELQVQQRIIHEKNMKDMMRTIVTTFVNLRFIKRQTKTLKQSAAAVYTKLTTLTHHYKVMWKSIIEDSNLLKMGENSAQVQLEYNKRLAESMWRQNERLSAEVRDIGHAAYVETRKMNHVMPLYEAITEKYDELEWRNAILRFSLRKTCKNGEQNLAEYMKEHFEHEKVASYAEHLMLEGNLKLWDYEENTVPLTEEVNFHKPEVISKMKAAGLVLGDTTKLRQVRRHIDAILRQLYSAAEAHEDKQRRDILNNMVWYRDVYGGTLRDDRCMGLCKKDFLSWKVGSE